MIGLRCSSGWWLAATAAVSVGCGVAVDEDHSRLSVVSEIRPAYHLKRVIEVEGRQGVATDGERYFVSGSTALFVYSIEPR